jgi:hypothetical protein
MHLFFQIHGYKNGHQLLLFNSILNRVDQDTIDRLSDISGPLRPGQVFEPYFTCYPLPSREFFVVAKTWQDLSVQRAGCVITKSLLIKMADWESVNNIASVFKVLQEASSNRDEVLNTEMNDAMSIPPVRETPVGELVEAIFLENRQPILVFDCREAENIAIRLYSVFWTSIRKTFSICTFSLSQRSVDGKPFDLLFAPTSVKSKFSEWQGRRIDASGISNKEPRHRWTLDLAARIFMNSVPSLFDSTDNSFFGSNSSIGNESTFRLTMLWNELLLKVEKEDSPMAILGLLDIINSQPVFAPELYQKLQPYIYNAIHAASNKLTTEDAWKFFVALLVKHQKKLMDRQMIQSVRESCAMLAGVDPQKAVDFVDNYMQVNQPIPPILFAGVADGIADYLDRTKNNDILSELSSSLGLTLMGSSRVLCQQIVATFDRYPDQTLSFLSSALQLDRSKETVRAKRNISPFVQFEGHKQILELLLGNADVQLFKEVLLNIGVNTKFKIRAFDNLLFKEAERLHQFEYLKEQLGEYDSEGYSDNLLIRIIRQEPYILRWLVHESKIPSQRLSIILSKILGAVTDKTIEIVSHDKILSEEILNSLSRAGNDESSGSIATLLCIADIDPDSALAQLNALTVDAIASVQAALIRNFISRVFLNPSIKKQNTVIDLLNKATQIDIPELFESLTSQNLPQQHLNIIIQNFLLAGPNITSKLTDRIEYVSRQIASNFSETIDDSLVKAWTFIFRESEYVKEAYTRSAAIMLDFAYETSTIDPTTLIATAFPVIYKTYQKGHNVGNTFLFIFFPDWDKCRTLRQDLVQRYINSNWSRFGLFRVASRTEILNDVLEILAEAKGGKKFINQAIVEAKSINIPDEDYLVLLLTNLKSHKER